MEQVKYFKFPLDEKTFQKWIWVCGIKSPQEIIKIKKSGTVCSDHFVEDDFILKDKLLNTPLLKRTLKKGAYPTIFVENIELESERDKRSEIRKRKKIINELLIESEEILKENVNPNMNHPTVKAEACPIKMLDENVCEISEHYSDSGTDFDIEILNENFGETSEHCSDSGIDFDIEILDEEFVGNMEYSPCLQNSKIDSGTQTMVDMKCALHLKIMELEQENFKLKKELKKKEDCSIICSNLKKIFTSGQMKKLLKTGKLIFWTSEDISSALSLHAAGPKLYRLMYKRGYPLPAPSTLRSWSKTVQFKPGIILPVLSVMKNLDYSE